VTRRAPGDADVPDRKAFLLRLDPAVWEALERLAHAELRSVNAEVEYLLRDALARRGVRSKATPRDDGGGEGE
jgi:hypothetical protein